MEKLIYVTKDDEEIYLNPPCEGGGFNITKVSELENDSGFITSADLPAPVTVPTKISELTNDSNFITSENIPTKISQLTNDSKFVTAANIPTKISELTNDSNFATTSQVPTKISELTNDSNFITLQESMRVTVCNQITYDEMSLEDKKGQLFIIKPLTLPEKGKAFNDYTLEEISIISQSGKASEYFNIGDEKLMNILGDEDNLIPMKIIGFDHDTISRTTKKAGITLLAMERTGWDSMNNAATSGKGWSESKMHTITLVELYNNLPDDLKNVIQTVDKYTNNVGAIPGAKDYFLQVDNVTDYVSKTEEKLFLLSVVEVGGMEQAPKLSNIYAAEGNKYEYFLGDDEVDICDKWWLRSPYIANSSYYHRPEVGKAWYYGDATDGRPIYIAFCI